MVKPPAVSLTTGARVKLSTVALMSMTVTLETVMGVYLEPEGGKANGIDAHKKKFATFFFLQRYKEVC